MREELGPVGDERYLEGLRFAATVSVPVPACEETSVGGRSGRI